MSRIGKAPIPVPDGVDVQVTERRITVKGPLGTLEREIPGDIQVRRDAGDGTEGEGTAGVLLVERPDDDRHNRALHGLMRSLVDNMVTGVTKGFQKDLEVVGVGYRATPQGPSRIELAVGYSHTVVMEAPEGITFEVPAPTRITVKGIDKQAVGQIAADIRSVRKPEPYKGKGIRYAGEAVRRKAGKSAK
jgi:large subunit ribosomal protein L6